MRNYEEVALQPEDQRTDLLVALYVDAPESSQLISQLSSLRARYPGSRINYLPLAGNFSRGVALDRAIRSSYCAPEDIVFFIDVDMIFTAQSIDRIRHNVIRGRQIYLPIVFSEYDPQTMGRLAETQMAGQSSAAGFTSPLANVSHPTLPANFSLPYPITDENGYFRQFGYGLAGIYKADLQRPDLKGFSTDITGWGLEDVVFIENVIALNQRGNQRLLAIADGRWDPFQLRTSGASPNPKASSSSSSSSTATGPSSTQHIPTVPPTVNGGEELSIFRAPDPSLVHIFHPIQCDTNLEEAQYKMCLGTKANTLGSLRTLDAHFSHSPALLMFARAQGRASA